MAICIESYIGAEGGKEGVKLEEQILVAEDSNELMTPFAFDENLLG